MDCICTGSCKSNYHMITTKQPFLLRIILGWILLAYSYVLKLEYIVNEIMYPVHGDKYNIYGIFYANNTFEVAIRKVSDHIFVCYGFRLSLTKRNPWFSNFLVSSNPLSRKSWLEQQALEYRIIWEIYTPYAGAAGRLLHINGKFTMGKLKSSLLS
jgi:hypothetical protein